MKYLLFLCIALVAGTAEAGQKDHYILKFGATWCGPCNQMDRNVWPKRSIKDEIKKFKNGKVYKFDSDTPTHRAIFVRYAITALPTVLIVDEDGKAVKRAVGGMSERQ